MALQTQMSWVTTWPCRSGSPRGAEGSAGRDLPEALETAPPPASPPAASGLLPGLWCPVRALPDLSLARELCAVPRSLTLGGGP